MCRGFEVIAEFSNGSIIAWSNIKLDHLGNVAGYQSPFSDAADYRIMPAKIKADELFRCSDWSNYLTAIQDWLVIH
jgi:hypothetical protein